MRGREEGNGQDKYYKVNGLESLMILDNCQNGSLRENQLKGKVVFVIEREYEERRERDIKKDVFIDINLRVYLYERLK